MSDPEEKEQPLQRQTTSFLKRRFREVGLQPASRHGQNFLIDLNLQQLLVDSAELSPDDVVLEVGTGTGALTARIAPRVAAVVSVEIDRHLFQLASEELIDCENVTLLQQDVLKNKNQPASDVLESVRERLGDSQRFKLVANLPYNIATPLISNLLACQRPPHSMTVTIQKELAERILAKPSTKDYGHLSIWIQSQCQAECVRIMPPTVFWPRPKVESAIVHITLDQNRRDKIPDLVFFHRFTRALFFHRRKFLRSVVVSAMKKELDKSEVDTAIAEVGLRPDERAEQLSVDSILILCESIRKRVLEKSV
ncbi:MAG: 16S rRNA (adenine(1518)-N(6)/adenine(1519)-N(6))-dimethyltransferase RsmA [Planctomycetota bacterium]|nr:16S rRNA (adenine(1518)-N(6)/adenine(1519)-N(6))-dimethyltransferase RsmA [Planctomycetota bacterium]